MRRKAGIFIQNRLHILFMEFPAMGKAYSKRRKNICSVGSNFVKGLDFHYMERARADFTLERTILKWGIS